MKTTLFCLFFILLLPSFSQAARTQKKPKTVLRQTKVTLLKRGRKPWRTLRYRWPARTRQLTLVNDITTATEVKMGKLQSPRIVFPVIRTTIRMKLKRKAGGRLRMEGRIASIRILGAPLYSTQMVRKIQRQITPLQGVRLWSEISKQGLLLRGDVMASALSKKRARGFYENFEMSMHQWSAILPAKSVGVGATWRVVIPFRRPFRGVQQLDCELLKRRGRILTILTRVSRVAPPQSLRTPPGAQKVSVRLQSFKVKGSGTSTFDLRTMVQKGRMSVVRQLHIVMRKVGVPARPFRMKAEVVSTVKTSR